jgi:subtilase family serine protease
MLDNGQPYVVHGVPHDGRSDLRIAEHALVTDLALTSADVTLDPAKPRPGETVVATIEVRNTGDLATAAFVVSIESGNVPMASVTIAAPFRGGEHRVVTLPFTYSGGPLVAVVDTANAIAESNESNNSAIVLPVRRRSVQH